MNRPLPEQLRSWARGESFPPDESDWGAPLDVCQDCRSRMDEAMVEAPDAPVLHGLAAWREDWKSFWEWDPGGKWVDWIVRFRPGREAVWNESISLGGRGSSVVAFLRSFSG